MIVNRDGFILVNKPFGWTSFDAVQYLKRKLRLKKAGHAGTLDPIATGLLIVLSEKYTVKFDSFMKGIKKYRTSVLFGVESDTDDITGKVKVAEKLLVEQKSDDFKDLFYEFINSHKGEIVQEVPKYASIKFKGKPLYKYARNGQEVTVQPRRIFIHDIHVDKIDFPYANIDITSDKGFYVRSFCRDIGLYCGVGALMLSLIRTGIGEYLLDDAKDIHDITLEDLRLLDDENN
ncbi:MAG: tRNA pseudouridine(55) synthase TruB [Candidatus Aureabacteria bacterium]|nr:tRNA pseudouridine(55) synthase TruB [Candidatus Auribacterota bacterium]